MIHPGIQIQKDSKGFKDFLGLNWLKSLLAYPASSWSSIVVGCRLSGHTQHQVFTLHIVVDHTWWCLASSREFETLGPRNMGMFWMKPPFFWVGFKIFTSKIMKLYEMNVPWAERPLASNYPWGFEVDRCKTIWKEGANDPRNHLEMGDGN